MKNELVSSTNLAKRIYLPILFALSLLLSAFSGLALAEQVTLAWDPNSEGDLAGYQVNYGTSSGTYSTVIDVGNTTTYAVTSLVAGQVYYFSVTAYDTEGLVSGYSNEVSAQAGGTQASYTITASAGSNGGISPSGDVTVSQGGSRSFTMTGNSGYHVADVTVDGGSLGPVNTYTFSNVTANHTISAGFALNSYTISAAAGANGRITPSGNVTVSHGGSRSFAVTASSGYHLSDVKVDGSSVGSVSSYTFSNVTANHSISASFEQDDPNQDSDGDGIPDQWESAHGLDPHADDASQDPDGDGISNLNEYLGGTDPAQFDANQAPDAPVLVSPADDDVVSLVPTLQSGEFYDPDYGDTHGATEWKIVRESDGVCVFDLQSPSALTAITVPPLILDDQTDYAWQVRFLDNHGAASDWSAGRYFTTRQDVDDVNGDGIPDSLQPDVTADVDGDGVLDVDEVGLKSIRIKGKATLLGIDTKNSPKVLKLAYLESVNPDDPGVLADTAGKPASMPFGLINFKVLVKDPGDQAELTVYFSETVPQDSIWYKYDAVEQTWHDFSDYVDISSSGKFLVLYLVDGGPGDADGVANGIIVDPSGLAAVLDSSGDTSGSNTGIDLPLDNLANMAGCFITSAAQDQSGRQQSLRRQEIRGREPASLLVLGVLACAVLSALQRIRRNRWFKIDL